MARDDFDIGVNNNIVSSIGSSSEIVVGSLAVSHDGGGGGGGGERTPLLVERFLGSLSIGSHWQSSSHASTGDEASLGHEPSSSVSCCDPRDDELDASKMKRKPEHAPPAEATWQQIAVVIIAEVVGVGVLSLPVAVAKVGWFGGVTLLLLMFPLNVYTALLLWRARRPFPNAISMMDLSQCTVGRTFSGIVAVSVFAKVSTGLGAYLLTAAHALAGTFYDVDACLSTWGLAVVVILMAPMQLRTFTSTTTLCIWNAFALLVAIGIAIVYISTTTPTPTPEMAPVMFAKGVDAPTFFGAVSTFVYAYGGHYMYLELMSEMAEPEHFPRVFWINGPFQVGLYSLVALTAYGHAGKGVPAFVIDAIPLGASYRIAQLLVFFHICVSFLIQGMFMSRWIHVTVSKSRVNDRTSWRASLEWFCITFTVTLVSWVLATSIPFFDLIIQFCGALYALITLVWPGLIWLFSAETRRRRGERALVALVCAFGVLVCCFGVYDALVSVSARRHDPDAGNGGECRKLTLLSLPPLPAT